eukprot:31473-Pelagococcus_subviridis.AAC.8
MASWWNIRCRARNVFPTFPTASHAQWTARESGFDRTTLTTFNFHSSHRLRDGFCESMNQPAMRGRARAVARL